MIGDAIGPTLKALRIRQVFDSMEYLQKYFLCEILSLMLVSYHLINQIIDRLIAEGVNSVKSLYIPFLVFSDQFHNPLFP